MNPPQNVLLTAAAKSAHGSSEATSASLLVSLRSDPGSVVWSQFVDRYRRLIDRWCRARGLQDCDRRDVTQDVLMSLATAMQKFQYDPSKSFRGWLRVVTNNAIHSFSKRNAKAGRGDGGSDVVSLLTSMESRQDLNERLQAEYDTELAEIAALRVRLRVKPKTWQAFQMTAVEGRSGAEVAQLLEMQVAHVYVAKSQVLNSLRNEIQKLEPDQNPSIHHT